MTGISLALRGVLLAGLVVAAIVFGAASLHQMTGTSASSVGEAHAMSAPVDSEAAVHNHAPSTGLAQLCNDACTPSHALVVVLCIAAVAAMLFLAASLKPPLVGTLLPVIASRTGTTRSALVFATTPSLSQLSVCRT